jgi:hypothetical protein
MCLVYHSEERLDSLSLPEFNNLVRESIAYSGELERTGNVVSASGLMPVSEAVTIRLRNGQPVATDGPFAETKEQLGGYYLIEARDLNDAIRIASKIPPLFLGSIEVRPLREIIADGESGITYIRK